jgi:hypothetical protein
MPRVPLPLNQFKEDIRHWVYNEGLGTEAIAHQISVRLGKPCSFRTIENRLRDWGFNRRNLIKDTTELRLRIAVLYQLSYSDTNIVRQLIKVATKYLRDKELEFEKRLDLFVE